MRSVKFLEGNSHQFRDNITNFLPDCKYSYFSERAFDSLTLRLSEFQQFSSNGVNLNSQAKTFTHEALAGADDTIFLEFMMGDIGPADVRFDDVSELKVSPDTRIHKKPIVSGGAFQLEPADPNPFNPKTTIKYQIAKPGHVEMSIYAINGVLVKTVFHRFHPAGNYQHEIDLSETPSGVYFCVLKSESQVVSRSIALIK